MIESLKFLPFSRLGVSDSPVGDDLKKFNEVMNLETTRLKGLLEETRGESIIPWENEDERRKKRRDIPLLISSLLLFVTVSFLKLRT